MERKAYEARARSMVNMQSVKIGSNFSLIVADLLFFANYNQLMDAIDHPEAQKKHLMNDFALFSRGSRLYDQIRIIDETGMELVRVNLMNGEPVIVQDKDLQLKADRYYFRDTFGLNKGEVFVSPFDLNIERGKIEKPLKPMIRFSTPFFDRKGQKRGIIIFNYLGAHLIQDIKDVVLDSPGFYMLLNSDGYWLAGRDPDEEWGFMFKDRKDLTMENVYPEAWKNILESESGQFHNKDGLFTFNAVYPLLESWKSSTGAGEAFEPSKEIKTAKEYYWKVVSFVPEGLIAGATGVLLKKYIYIFLMIIAVLAAGSWLLASAQFKRNMSLQELAKVADELNHANRELVAEVKERMSTEDKLKSLLEDKELLMKELHHRVKNNMTVIYSLLNLQADKVEDARYKEMFNDSMNRIKTMASIHEKLYRSEDLSRIVFSDYIADMADRMYESYGLSPHAVKLTKDIERIVLGIDAATPCGLIVGELLSNALKYAFPEGREGEIRVSLREHDDEIELTVSDNGAGIPEGLDFRNADTLGLNLVNALVRQLQGNMEVFGEHGARFQITFRRSG
jgi:two-component sensor histidine kinase